MQFLLHNKSLKSFHSFKTSPFSLDICSPTLVTNTISLGGNAVCPTNAGLGYGMFGYSGIGLGIASSANGSNTLFNQATGSFTSAFFKYTVSNGANARSGEILSVWNGASAQFTDNSTVDIGTTTAVTASVIISGANVRLNIQTNTAGWKIKSLGTFM